MSFGLIGVALTLAILPALSILGFGTLAMAPTIAVVVVYQVLRRAGNFAFARPTREVLFTVVPREDKYKAKSFIDTVIYRTGDQVGAWSFAALGFLGLAMTGVSIVAIPISIAWLAECSVAWAKAGEAGAGGDISCTASRNVKSVAWRGYRLA